MWNNYWGNRDRRNVPQVNYREQSSDENSDEYNSPLVSPSRPPPTRAGSPVELAVPTLSDNVDEELVAVSQTLQNVGHTHTFRRTRPSVRPDPEGGDDQSEQEPLPEQDVGEEEVVEGHVVESAVNPKVEDENGGGGADPEDDNMVNIDVEDGVDGDKAPEQARAIKVEFDANDIVFWFVQLEDEMVMASVKSQWLKKTILQRNLPVKQKEDVKALLSLPKEGSGSIYKNIKSELIRIYAPKPADSYRKALTRTMVGLPSQLGYQIVDDICKKSRKLEGCCCAGAAQALWTQQLPVNIRNHISDREFNVNTYKEVFEAADKCFMSSKQVNVAAIAVAKVDLDETQAAFLPQNQPTAEVAAFRGGARGGRGSGRGGSGRGGRGNGRGGGRGGQSGQGGQGGAPKTRKRHESMPPEECCDRHYTHGASAWFCLKPLTCPWVSKVIPRN